jgi:hypothetical protein
MITPNLFQISPVDNSFIDKVKDMDKNINNLQRTRQPYVGEWYEFNPTLFAYVSDNVVSMDQSLVDNRTFQIGDKIRIFQDGAYKFFNIVDINSSNISLLGGSDYTFDNSAFTTFALSRSDDAYGFPPLFNFLSTVIATPPLTIVNQGTFTGLYRIKGDTIQLFMKRIGAFQVGGSPSAFIQEQTPLDGILISSNLVNCYNGTLNPFIVGTMTPSGFVRPNGDSTTQWRVGNITYEGGITYRFYHS